MISTIPDTMTIDQAMNRLHCSRTMIETLMYRGQLAYYKIGAKVLIDSSSLANLFAHCYNESVLWPSARPTTPESRVSYR